MKYSYRWICDVEKFDQNVTNCDAQVGFWLSLGERYYISSMNYFYPQKFGKRSGFLFYLY